MALTQVRSDGIATGAVTATQIATGAVTANDLEDSGVSAGTYGSSSAIPAITVDAKGRITSASTSSIDSTSISNGTSSVSIIEDANIQFARGGTNQLEVDGSGLLFQDGKKIRMGGSADLEIYHDGSNSYVHDNGTGELRLNSGNAVRIRKHDNETMALFTADGAAALYHDNSEKLATTSTGIDVTGTVSCDGITIDGNGTLTGGDLTIGSSTDTAVFARLDFEDSGGSGFINLNAHGTADFKLLHNRSGSAIDGMPNSSGGIATAYGIPIYFTNNNTARAYFDTNGHFRPAANNTYDLGASTERWRNVYTNDLNLSNEGGSNDVDGTWGSWTIQEGEDDLFLINGRSGKKYKFNLTEVN